MESPRSRVMAIIAIGVFFGQAAFAQNEAVATEANPALKADWLFQCDNKPTAEAIKLEIGYARDMAKRISPVDCTAELTELSTLEKSTSTDAQATYLAVRKIKRAIAFKNPLIDFKQILLIDNPYPKGVPGDATDEWSHEARHRNGFMRQMGGRMLLVGLTPGDEPVDLMKGRTGSFWRPDLSYDAKKIVFSFCPETSRSFHLYEINSDGTGFQQLTIGDYDDLDPVYNPDGKLTFCTSRQHSYVRCMPMTHSFAMARCDGDGKNIYILSANGEPEYLPSVLNDGKIMFTRWEYTDKALWRIQSLWTMDPDGCSVQTLWGSQSVWPDVLTEARAIPNSSKILFTGLGHHHWWDGSIGIVDPTKGLNYPDGLLRITRDVAWAEVGNGPADPAPHVEYHNAGKFYAYKTPYPLSEDYFLVSAREGSALGSGEKGRTDTFRLYLMDVWGNRELIYKGQYNAFHAMPFKPRTKPPAISDKVKWPKIGAGEQAKNAVFYSNDVFANAPDILREKGKFLRVLQMDPKTYTTWYKTVQHDGPAVSVFQADGVKRILGTIPIEADGSVNFEVPPGESLFFQMLDAEGRCIYVMRSFANGMPGEVRGCFGCHETSMKNRGIQSTASYRKGKALQNAPLKLKEPSWGANTSVGYKRFVQTVLDKHCGSCHQKEGTKAYQKLNLTYRFGGKPWRNWVYDRPGDKTPFCEPYLTLVNGDCRWGNLKEMDERGVPRNLAGVFIVEGYNKNDPKSVETLPPYSAFSAVSQLIQIASSGKHHDVKVTGEDLERLIAWVDCNGPFLGEEEIRQHYDPSGPAIENVPPVRPRIATAPHIDRFNLRQDGDSMALCGPLKLQPDREPNFDPNKDFAGTRHTAEEQNMQSEKLKIELLSAQFGAGKNKANVLPKLQENFKGTRLIKLPGAYNKTFGDPAPKEKKMLIITYTINGGEPKRIAFKENSPIILEK
jgi:hypothetical protein